MTDNNKIHKTGYISEVDKFLRNFDKNRQQFPESRLKEVAKYKKIYAKRDGTVTEEKSAIWEGF